MTRHSNLTKTSSAFARTLIATAMAGGFFIATSHAMPASNVYAKTVATTAVTATVNAISKATTPSTGRATANTRATTFAHGTTDERPTVVTAPLTGREIAEHTHPRGLSAGH